MKPSKPTESEGKEESSIVDLNVPRIHLKYRNLTPFPGESVYQDPQHSRP